MPRSLDASTRHGRVDDGGGGGGVPPPPVTLTAMVRLRELSRTVTLVVPRATPVIVTYGLAYLAVAMEAALVATPTVPRALLTFTVALAPTESETVEADNAEARLSLGQGGARRQQ